MSLVRNPNIFYGMGRRRRRRRGSGFFSSIGDAVGKVGHFLKENHALSRAVGLIPHPLGLAGSLGLRALGLGRRKRRVTRRRVGRPRNVGRPRKRGGFAIPPPSTLARIGQTVGRAGRFLKNSHALSRLVGLIPHPLGLTGSMGLRALGLGRRRRYRRRRGGEVGLGRRTRRVGRPRLSARRRGGDLMSLTGGRRKRRVTHRRVRRVGGANFFSTEQLAVPRF